MMINTVSLYKHKLLTFVSIVALLWVIASCQKKDNIKPIIKLQNTINSSYQVGDTIHIMAEISDNNTIQQTSVYIINNKTQRVGNPYVYQPNGKTYLLETRYSIDNLKLENGIYYLVIEAKDQENTSLKYIKINIKGIEKALNQIIIIESDNSKTDVYSTQPEKHLLKTINEPYQDFIYNPYTKQYVFLSKNGNISAYSKKDFECIWSDNELNNPLKPYNGKLDWDMHKTFVSSGKGDIRYYNKDGYKIWQANSNTTNGFIYDYHFFENEILSINHTYDISYDEVERFNTGIGASTDLYPLTFTPEQIVNVEAQLYLVVGNEGNIAKACSLSTYYDLVQNFKIWEDRHIIDAFRYSKYVYLFAFDHQITEYYLPNNEEQFILSLNKATKFYYEVINQTLFYIEDNQIYRLNYPANGSTLFYSNSKPIRDIIFVYNK